MQTLSVEKVPSKQPTWTTLVSQYQTPSKRKGIWQICNSFIPYVALWYLMYLGLEMGYWITLILAPPAAGFVVRLFIIQHDCGHGSFFNTKTANDSLGRLFSLITLVPYQYWRKGHAIHHANSGNLEHRGIGDIRTITVNEYLQRSKWGQFRYRFYRNPLFLFAFVPTVLFVLLYRFPTSLTKPMRRVEASVYWTNLGLAILIGSMIWLVGLKSFLIIQSLITVLASTAGTWLFFVQHQYEDAYWATNDNWDFTKAALQGSSYMKLPKILQWFTGNIGFHHIHHLSPKIPNYRLEQCYKENPLFQESVVLTLRTSLKSPFLTLWDEKQKKLISFRQFKRHQLDSTMLS